MANEHASDTPSTARRRLAARRTAISRNRGSASHNRDEPGSDTHKESLAGELLLGLLLCALLAWASLWFSEHTFIGQQFEAFSYRVLQWQLTPGKPVVTIVDISDLAPEGEDQVTSRDKLQWILKAVAQQRPRVVGIDIDFSPHVAGNELQYKKGAVDYQTPEDPKFFRLCLDQGNVYLGIFRTELLGPEQWLGAGDFSKLAASLWVPGDARTVARSLALSGESKKRKRSAPTLSDALSTAYRKGSPSEGWAQAVRSMLFAERSATPLEEAEDAESKTLKLDESYVDYSLLRNKGETFPQIHLPKSALQDEHTLDAVIDSGAESLHDRIVLLGDASKPTDVFVNPALGQAAPGVEIQAAAANTFATGPFYVLPAAARFWLDFAMATTVFLLWLFLSRRYPRFNKDRLLTLFVTISAIAVVASALLVNVTHIVWNDFLFIALGLAVHPVTHRSIHRFRHHLSAAVKQYLYE